MAGTLFVTAATCYAIYKRCYPTVAVHFTQNEINITVHRKPDQLSQDEKIALVAGIKKWKGPQGYRFPHWIGQISTQTNMEINPRLTYYAGKVAELPSLFGTFPKCEEIGVEFEYAMNSSHFYHFKMQPKNDSSPSAIDAVLQTLLQFYQIDANLFNSVKV